MALPCGIVDEVIHIETILSIDKIGEETTEGRTLSITLTQGQSGLIGNYAKFGDGGRI